MEEIYAACVTYELSLSDYVNLKKVTEPVWILGKQYNALDDEPLQRLNEDIRSKVWFTYRKNFLPIEGTSLSSDSGWGCMHRCGQMLMAQAYILRYLGKDWRWKPDNIDEKYLSILSQFNDKVECPYSIHKIASKGCILQKKIGQWFGPNTIVQVLKKLAEDDPENDVAVHVAMDNMVIKNEIRKLFRKECEACHPSESQNSSQSRNVLNSQSSQGMSNSNKSICTCNKGSQPVLLTIPLRLGLCDIIPAYFEKLKGAFTMKQSLGIIGGRTNLASYFIGYIGNELIYLDPHTTQIHKSEGLMADQSYHCEHPSRMDFSQLDPSIALCFYLENEADFEQWCIDAQHVLREPEKDALFEILEERIAHLPYMDAEVCDDFDVHLDERDRIYTSDEEFEILM